MPKRRPLRVPRDEAGGLNLSSYGRKGQPLGSSTPASWASHMGSSADGAKEVMVKISGGGRDADGVQAASGLCAGFNVGGIVGFAEAADAGSGPGPVVTVVEPAALWVEELG